MRNESSRKENDRPVPSIKERFEEKYKISRSSKCWEWIGAISTGGYGRFFADGKPRQAHSVAMLIYRGVSLRVNKAGSGLNWDHLCRNRKCVNPSHLELVTCKENRNRGKASEVLAAMNKAKTHCPRGHEYAGSNLYVHPNGARGCRTCRYDIYLKWKSNKTNNREKDNGKT